MWKRSIFAFVEQIFLRVVSHHKNLLNSVISPFCCIFASFIFCSLSVSERTHWRNTQSRWSRRNCSGLNRFSIVLFCWILVADWLFLSCNRFLHRWSRCSASCRCCCRAGCCCCRCWLSCCCWSCLDFLQAIRHKPNFRYFIVSNDQDFRGVKIFERPRFSSERGFRGVKIFEIWSNHNPW